MSHSTLSLVSALAFAVPGFAQGNAGGEPLNPVPYDVTDEIRGSDVQLAAFPVRPLQFVWRGAGRPTRIWAVNQAEDLVEAFQYKGSSSPDLSLHVPWNPVSLGYWNNTGAGSDEILVVCRGTWGVTRLDATTGKIVGHITLLPEHFGGKVGIQGHGRMAEPADIIVDESTDMAFVSCSSSDAVVQIDLVNDEVVRVFHATRGLNGTADVLDTEFQCKHPLFLSFGPAKTDGTPRSVYVTPMHSGNNTTLRGPSIVTGNPGSIEDAGANASSGALPDEDLFEISPWTSTTSPGSVEARVTGIGTILFGHGTNPITGETWCLNVEMHNEGEANSSEPAVKGRFATSRVSRFNVPSTGDVAVDPGDINDLEGSGIAPHLNMGQPYGLAFGLGGTAYVAGILTDNVVGLDSAGNIIGGWSLPEGAIPRGLHFQRVGAAQHVYVHCWGTETVLDYDVSQGPGSATLLGTYQLTSNPAADQYRRGRELFFDGGRSETGTMSCATCHIDGGSDQLAWDLSAHPIEEKGPMVTQTLVGIDRLGPFHWRGERDFADFNGAFEALLGNHNPTTMGKLTATEFRDFHAFVFSLRNPANPNQNRDRMVDPSIKFPLQVAAPTGNAVLGQTQFFDRSSIGTGQSCNDCHTAPTGTASDLFPIFNVPGPLAPVRRNEKPSALHELWRKFQPQIAGTGINGGEDKPLLGFGFSHGGANFDLHDFLDFVEAASPAQGNTVEQRSNITDFVFQWDQGIAPAAHFAFFVDADSVSDGSAVVHARNYLGLQYGSANLNCDVVVIGETLVGGSLQKRRWFRDRVSANVFVCEDSNLLPRSSNDFLVGAAVDGESHLFVAYPMGMGERFGYDRDMDSLSDFVDPAPYTPDTSNPSTTGPSLVGSPQVLWVNAKHARLSFQTNAPAQVLVSYREVGASPNTNAFAVTGPNLARFHAPVLNQLRPSTGSGGSLGAPAQILPEDVQFEYWLEMTDRWGVSNTVGPFPVTTSTDPNMPTFIRAETFLDSTFVARDEATYHQHMIESSRVVEVTPGSGTYRVDASVRYVRGADQMNFAEDRAVIGRVLIQRCKDLGSGLGIICDEVEQVPDALITAGTGAFKRDVTLSAPGTPPVALDVNRVGASMPNTDPFLVGLNRTDDVQDPVTGHTFSMEFTLSPSLNLDSNDRVYFSFDAIPAVEDDAVWTASVNAAMTSSVINIPLHSRLSAGQWNFSAGKEVTAQPYFELP